MKENNGILYHNILQFFQNNSIQRYYITCTSQYTVSAYSMVGTYQYITHFTVYYLLLLLLQCIVVLYLPHSTSTYTTIQYLRSNKYSIIRQYQYYTTTVITTVLYVVVTYYHSITLYIVYSVVVRCIVATVVLYSTVILYHYNWYYLTYRVKVCSLLFPIYF